MSENQNEDGQKEEDAGKTEAGSEDELFLKKLKQALLRLFQDDEDLRKAISGIAPKEPPAAALLKEKESEIKKLRAEIDDLQRNAANSQKECAELKRTLSEKEQAISALNRQLSEAKAEAAAALTENREKEAAIENLQRNAANSQKECAELKHALSEKDQAISALNKQLSEAKAEAAAALREKTAAAESLESFRRKYASMEELERVYNVYTALPPDLKTSMAGFLRGESLLAFVVSGARDSRLDMFWEFCRTEVQKSSGLRYAGEIAGIFRFFFTEINALIKPPLYEIIEPQNGQSYDDSAMILSNSTAAKNGSVERTVLPGYRGKKSQKAVKQAIVILKG
ncbi:hypothetical protein ACYULU_01070 [Breznakiellaceae bacterium SP9]